jgi:Arc/MetJ-type ribon-helix-helix transcriptional regulator
MYFGCVTVETQDVKKCEAAVSARIPNTLKQLMKRFVAIDAHVNESDFIRDAIREKIQRDAPDLYRQLFREVAT